MIKLANNSNEFIGLESLLKDIDSISEETIFSIDSENLSFLYCDSSSNIDGIEIKRPTRSFLFILKIKKRLQNNPLNINVRDRVMYGSHHHFTRKNPL